MVLSLKRLDEGLVRTRPGRLDSANPEALISGPARTTTLPISNLDDGLLIERCVQGDREALAELYRRHKGEAMRFIRHAVRNTQDADDILQEVFVEVSRSLRRFEGRAAFSTWLHRICVRTAVRQMKRRYRQVGESQEDESRSEAPDPHAGPDEGVATRERARRIRSLLERIAPKKRMVLVLHDLEGVSPKEISALVGAPVLTVRTRLFYARKELAAMAAQDPALAEFFSEEGGPRDVMSA
jgi:RNA polymerase sigma-70 factor (ECF subfamily)